MTDLAKLASEITPEPWEVERRPCSGGWYHLEIITAIGGELLAGDEQDMNRIKANATAMSLVPELIVEVLRLREENARQKDQVYGILDESLETCNQYLTEGKSRQDTWEFVCKTYSDALKLIAKVFA